ncbi:MAG: hypothetical protein HYT40_01750 [Candidatus Sungbacteria bacterium]|uniref:Uncharacterized protein n=1 Tax=Candidatus Sungiibacteriota bacterium TaxID=2750080 RepID=A0A931SD30_9BACT|nr:hypothetical protein [Candidatus Sungbacteria bacterium]
MTRIATLGLVLSSAIFSLLVLSVGGALVSSSDLFKRWGSRTSFANTQEAALLANAGVSSGANVAASTQTQTTGGLAFDAKTVSRKTVAKATAGATTTATTNTETRVSTRTETNTSASVSNSVAVAGGGENEEKKDKKTASNDNGSNGNNKNGGSKNNASAVLGLTLSASLETKADLDGEAVFSGNSNISGSGSIDGSENHGRSNKDGVNTGGSSNANIFLGL